MKSNYKRLGNYIGVVDKRNRSLEIENLIGLSIQKKFIPSISNTIGTDMSTYRIINHYQFAYCPVTSRNGEKVTVALYQEDKTAMVSQAYDVFEIKNEKELLPEYLMMWFRRPEFDRYARFMSHGSVREMFSWEDMCEVMLPVPHPDKQKEIVKEYNTIVNRIALNKQLIQKLEETAQAIYKQWFVDFEFPDEEGKAYKSSGGEMEWNEELGKEIPKGWEIGKLKDISHCLDFKRRPLSELERNDFKGNFPYYGAMGIVDYVKDFIFDGEYLLFSEDGVNVIDDKGHPSVFLVWGKFWVNNHAHILDGKDGFTERFLYLLLKEVNVSDIVTGAAQPKINQDNMNSIKVFIPAINVVQTFDNITNPIFDKYKNKIDQNNRLKTMKELLLSKLATIEN